MTSPMSYQPDPVEMVLVAEVILGTGLIGSGQPGIDALEMATRVLATVDQHRGDPDASPKLRDALCSYLDHRADYADRGDFDADFRELWSYVAPSLTTRAEEPIAEAAA